MSVAVDQALPHTLGVILAGGNARRMGGTDKPLLMLGGETLLQRIVRRLAPQCKGLIVNANGDPTRFSGVGLTVVPDPLPDRPGPLAGILAALDWAAAHRPELEWVTSVPGDTPFLPANLVSRLHEACREAGAPIACAVSGERLHPTVGLWAVSLREDLRHVLTREDTRSVRVWAKRHGLATASWDGVPRDPFFNINTPADLSAVEAMLAGAPAHAAR